MSDTHHYRNSPRPQLAVQVELIRKNPDQPPITAYTQDIGTGGLCLMGKYDLAPAEQVRVLLSTPSTWAPLELEAEVTWKNKQEGSGLKFVNLTQKQSLALAAFVSALDFKD